jgi:membrane protease YdiL (CAAX protease family)
MWRGLSFLTGLLFVPVFVLNVYSLTDPWLVITWLALATIDPWIEEGYWRGLLIDVAAQQWPPWLAIGYSTVCFGLSHPLLLGVSVHALAGVSAFVGTLFTGSIWAIVYWKTRSLRWPVASHAVVDLLNVSVLVFLNRAVIPGQ